MGRVRGDFNVLSRDIAKMIKLMFIINMLNMLSAVTSRLSEFLSPAPGTVCAHPARHPGSSSVRKFDPVDRRTEQ